ncbi:hypothetical protein Fmac_005590 [Flemingia macrophylla]|uniref:RING-type E3 ubiquitin transferase n=1 Tax=Flemingia macrophylla TaxID=520843 RepID=A0ABD1N8A1_9FABA
MSESDPYQRQLQQLFHLHDSGLDQAFIDALPLFLYKDIIGGSLYDPGFAFENPVYDLEGLREEDGVPGSVASEANKHAESHIMSGKRVFSVRLGKFRSSNGEGVERGGGESSTSNLDVRRCYSMGSFQYVVADSDLQVALCTNRGDGGGAPGGSMRQLKGRLTHCRNSSTDGDVEGKKINIARKGESFSVSKIWQWSRKDKVSSSQENHLGDSAALPWMNGAQGTLGK